MKIALVGEKILKTPAINVAESELLTDQFIAFVDELKHTMLSANGIGIAAPQVFDPRAVMIIASRPNSRYPDAPNMAPLVMINPIVNASSDDKIAGWEGCLSVPSLRGKIKRHEWIEVEYLSMQGEKINRLFDGFVARIFQHEYDHLVGKTWLDHIESSDDIMAESVWSRIQA
jgi:peptide deformylase